MKKKKEKYPKNVKESMQHTMLRIENIIINPTTRGLQVGFSSSGFSFILQKVAGKQQQTQLKKNAFYCLFI